MKSLTILLFFISLRCFSHPAVGIVMDSKGNVFYSDTEHVWKIDKATNKKSIAIRNVHTHELCIDKQDNLFGEHVWYTSTQADPWNHYVWKYDAAGKFEKIKPDTKGFLENYSFVRDHHGTMYWAERDNACQKIGKRNADGTIQTIGDNCMRNIRWMTASVSGNLFLVDLNEIRKVDRQGHVVTVASAVQNKKDKDQHAVMGLSTDANDNVYAAVSSEKKVKKITPSGAVFTIATTGATWIPTGTLSTPDGDLWILECNAVNQVRVECITKEGIRTVY